MAKKTVHISSTSKGMQTTAKTEEHQMIIDEPQQMGGENEGADPLEYLLAALAGCENVVANMAAKEIDFDLQNITFEINGELDLDGMMGNENVRPYFQSVTIDARVKTSESEERLAEFQQIVDSRCPVYTALAAANVEMTSNWIID